MSTESATVRRLLVPLLDACVQLGIERRQMYRLIDAGAVRRVKIGARVYIPQEDIDAYYQTALAQADGVA